MKYAHIALVSSLLMLGAVVPAVAQTHPLTGPHGAYLARCGNWINGVWVSNGRCSRDPYAGRAATVRGTITSVSGHLVTIQRTKDTLVINDSPALNRQTSGRVAVGRQIVARGFWRDGTFFATSIM